MGQSTDLVSAIGAGALNKTIRQEQLVILAVCLVGRLQSKQPIIMQVFVRLLRYPLLWSTVRTACSLAAEVYMVCSCVDVLPHLSKPI